MAHGTNASAAAVVGRPALAAVGCSRYERARRADDVMEGAFWIGLPLLVTGVAMLATGLALRNNARARARMAAAPGGVELRF